LLLAISSQPDYATLKALLLADATSIQFGDTEEANAHALRKGATLTVKPGGETMHNGRKEDEMSVEFTTVGYDEVADNAHYASLIAAKDERYYFYFLDPMTETVRRTGLMLPEIEELFPGTEKESFKVTAMETGDANAKMARVQFGTGAYTPFIQITTPNTAVTYGQGDTVNIAWNANFSDAVKIELFKGASLNLTINAGIGALARTYAWVIPADQTAGTDYSIKITRVAGVAAADESAVDFEIEA
jgi:hypothetical protein